MCSSETAAAAVEPAEGAVQRSSRRHPTETAGVRSSDPSEPGRQPRTGVASGAGGHRSHSQ